MDILDNDDVFDNDILLNILQKIKNDVYFKERICSRSYLHINNFYKINLGTLNDETIIRLHYWLKVDDPKQNPHSHGWDFTSKIIRGGIKEYVTSSNPEGEFTLYKQNLTKHTKSSYINNYLQKYIMFIRKQEEYNCDMIYNIGTNVIHTAFPLHDKTITILKQSKLTKDDCDIYSEENIEGVNRRENLTFTSLNTILDDIIEYLYFLKIDI